MAGIDKNTLFCLTGESFNDSSYNNINITSTGLTEANIEDEEIEGQTIKCINFNTTNGYLTFTLDDSFFKEAWTIDWWEKDSSTYPGLSGLFTNMVASSGNYFGIGKYTTGKRTFVNMAENGSYFMSNQPIGDDMSDVWVHKAIVFDGLSTYKIYVEGKLYATISNTKKAYSGKNTFQMGRWRTEKYALHRKIYNFRVSSCARYTEEFTPSIEKYTEEVKNHIVIDALLEDATLIDISNKVKELKDFNIYLKEILATQLVKKGVEVSETDKIQDLVEKISLI